MIVNQFKASKYFWLTAMCDSYVRLARFSILIKIISIDSYFFLTFLLCFYMSLEWSFWGTRNWIFKAFLRNCTYYFEMTWYTCEFIILKKSKEEAISIAFFNATFLCEKLRHCFKVAGELTQDCFNMRRWIV